MLLLSLTDFLKQIKKGALPKSIGLQLKAENIASFIKALSNKNNSEILQSISTLDLSGSELTVDETTDLVTALNNLPNLKRLRLNQCKLTDKHSEQLAQLQHVRALYLKGNLLIAPTNSTYLRSLYLDENSTLEARKLFIQTPFKMINLEHLSLSGCGIQSSDLVFLDRLRLIGKDAKLSSLNLRKNQLNHEVIEFFPALLSLSSLDLGENRHIGDIGIQHLGKVHALKFNKLTALYLDGSGITISCLLDLAKMSLQILDLSHNSLGGTELQALIRPKPAFILNTILTLNLSFCRLKDKDAKALNRLFPYVKNLDVANNSFSYIGAAVLSKLKKRVSVKLIANPLTHGAAGKDEFERAIPGLEEVNLDGTNTTDSLVTRVRANSEGKSKVTIVGRDYTEETLKQKRDRAAARFVATSSATMFASVPSPVENTLKELERLKKEIITLHKNNSYPLCESMENEQWQLIDTILSENSELLIKEKQVEGLNRALGKEVISSDENCLTMARAEIIKILSMQVEKLKAAALQQKARGEQAEKVDREARKQLATHQPSQNFMHKRLTEMYERLIVALTNEFEIKQAELKAQTEFGVDTTRLAPVSSLISMYSKGATKANKQSGEPQAASSSAPS